MLKQKFKNLQNPKPVTLPKTKNRPQIQFFETHNVTKLIDQCKNKFLLGKFVLLHYNLLMEYVVRKHATQQKIAERGKNA